MLQVSWKNRAKISFSWALEGLAYIQLANVPDMHPSLQGWCVQLQLASSTQIHRTTIRIVSYLHTPLSMRMGHVSHSHKMAYCISFSTLTTPREEGKKIIITSVRNTKGFVLYFHNEKIYINALYRRHKCAVQIKCSTSISVLYK